MVTGTVPLEEVVGGLEVGNLNWDRSPSRLEGECLLLCHFGHGLYKRVRALEANLASELNMVEWKGYSRLALPRAEQFHSCTLPPNTSSKPGIESCLLGGPCRPWRRLENELGHLAPPPAHLYLSIPYVVGSHLRRGLSTRPFKGWGACPEALNHRDLDASF